MLEVRNVTKRFRKGASEVVALQNVSFCADKGVLVLLGLNGAGKTTLLNLIAGILVPDEGEVLIDGVPADKCRECVGI